MRTLIKNAFVVSVDPTIGNIDGADILVDDGRIAAIEPKIDAADAELIDATGHVAAPGFVDTHHHLWQAAMRGLTADFSLLNYFMGIRMFAASFFRPEEMYAAQLHGALQALNAGVTSIADYCHNIHSPDHAEESIRGVRDSRARVIWCYGFNQAPVPHLVLNGPAQRADHLRGLAVRHFASKDELVTLGVSPEESFFWPDIAYGRTEFAVAREVSARIFWHANSTRNLATNAPHRDAAVLAEAGLLGRDVVLVHMGITEPDEWAHVAAHGAHLSFTPETELQMSLGWPSLKAAQEHGIDFGFGIDITSNNSADLRFQLRLMLQAERHLRRADHLGETMGDVALSCEDALYWGTMGGAKVMGLDHLVGSLSPGKAADIVLHDMRGISMTGWNRANPASALIMHGGTDSVATVLVGGRIVKREGQLLDEQRACALLRAASDHVYGEIDRHGGMPAAASRKLAELQAG